MNKKITKIQHIKNHLLMYGSITVRKSITTYGIDRVPAYIGILKHKRNWDIESVRKRNKTTWWVEYQLKNYPNS